jgi:hypothetical protein
MNTEIRVTPQQVGTEELDRHMATHAEAGWRLHTLSQLSWKLPATAAHPPSSVEMWRMTWERDPA